MKSMIMRMSLVAAMLGAFVAAPAGPAQAWTCYEESAMYVRAGGDLAIGTQSTQYNFNRVPNCSNGLPMANTTFLKLAPTTHGTLRSGTAKDPITIPLSGSLPNPPTQEVCPLGGTTTPRVPLFPSSAL